MVTLPLSRCIILLLSSDTALTSQSSKRREDSRELYQYKSHCILTEYSDSRLADTPLLRTAAESPTETTKKCTGKTDWRYYRIAGTLRGAKATFLFYFRYNGLSLDVLKLYSAVSPGKYFKDRIFHKFWLDFYYGMIHFYKNETTLLKRNTELSYKT